MTQLSVYCWHGDKSWYTRADPTKTHGQGIAVRGPQIGGRLLRATGTSYKRVMVFLDGATIIFIYHKAGHSLTQHRAYIKLLNV